MKAFTRVFPRIGLQSRGALDVNTIIIPEYHMEKTLSMCESSYESAGWLICKKQFSGDYIAYLIEYIFQCDKGGVAHVYPTKKLNLPEEYSAIEFHVHPQGLGDHWFNKFSTGDYDTLIKRQAEQSSYKHVLFTPTHILTCGKELPGIRVTPSSDFVKDILIEKEQFWKSIVEPK